MKRLHPIFKRFSSSIASHVIKEPKNALTNHLIDTIHIQGPLSIATFMRACLTHPLQGYYMKEIVFGQKGDFITAPEISQIFGELVGIWFLFMFQQHQQENISRKFRFVELGPGRGTLMEDALRSWTQCNNKFIDQLEAIHFVEASPQLRNLQAQRLNVVKCNDGIQKTSLGIPVYWHDTIQDVPNDMYTMFLAHEFFDALPIYRFQKTKNGWREVMIDVDPSTMSPFHFKFVLAPAETKASKTLLNDARYEAFKLNDQIEVSPDVWSISKEIALRIHASDGVALIVDYGQETIPATSLRAIQSHEFKSILGHVGQCDLSADVDFSMIAHAAKDLVTVHPTISQREFLIQMGIEKRFSMLYQIANQQQRQDLVSACKRLIGTEAKEMGAIYRFLAMTSKRSTSAFPFDLHKLRV